MDKNEGQKKTNYTKIIDDFLRVEKSLNSQLFWILFGFVYIDMDYSNKSQKQKLINAITKERMSISLEDRSKLSNSFYLMMSHSSVVNRKHLQDLNRSDVIKGITLISDKNNIPYMGWQYKEKIFWPNEKPTWTAAAMLLAADAVFGYTSAADLFLKNQLDSFLKELII